MGTTQMSSSPKTEAPRLAVGAAPALKGFWQRAHHGRPASFPLVQFPNVPFIVAVTGLLIAALTTGSAHDYAQATFHAAAAMWAWLELTSGVNWPHRVPGAAGVRARRPRRAIANGM
jgi:hypothetical protein